MKRADQLNQSILTVEEIEHRAQLMFDTHQDMGLCRRSELVTVSQRFQAALRRFNKTVYRILPDIDPEVVDPFIVPEYRRESKAGIDKVVGLMNKIHQERFGYRTTSWEQYTSEDLGWVRSGPAQIGALILSPDVENDIKPDVSTGTFNARIGGIPPQRSHGQRVVIQGHHRTQQNMEVFLIGRLQVGVFGHVGGIVPVYKLIVQSPHISDEYPGG